MADISAEIAAFKNAVYGEDVRDAMVSLANKVNNELSNLNKYAVRGGSASTHTITDLSTYSSLAELPTNGIYLVGQSGNQIFPDFPSNIHYGTLICMNHEEVPDAVVQIFAEQYGNIYIRNKFGNSSAAFYEWKQLNRVYNAPIQNIDVISSSSQYASLAALPTNSIALVNISGQDSFPDFPNNTGVGNGIAFTLSRTQRDYIVQFYFSSAGVFYYRIKFGSSANFTKWFTLSYDAPVIGNKRIINSSSQIASLAELPVNEICLVGLYGSDTLPDFPTNIKSGLAISLNYSSSNDARSQIFMESSGLLWYRHRFGANSSFTKWYCLNKTESELPSTLYYSFNIVGVIGDSLATGAEQDPYDGNNWKFPDEGRWGYVLSQASGKTYKYFTKGGVSTRTWFTDAKCYPLASLAENYCQCYIIGLGENDSYNLGADYLGTSSDINDNDPDQNGDTYYGNYAKIIQKMKQQVPDAKFFLITNPHNQTDLRKNYNEAVRYIGSHFTNCYVVDLARHYETEFNSGYINSCRRGGHYCSSAYHWMGEIIAKEINSIMYTNPTDFYGVQFIRTQSS